LVFCTAHQVDYFVLATIKNKCSNRSLEVLKLIVTHAREQDRLDYLKLITSDLFMTCEQAQSIITTFIKHQIIGSINDDPYKCLSEADLDLLKYIIHGFNKQYSVFKNISIFIQAIKWRMLHSLVIYLSKVLKSFLPRKYPTIPSVENAYASKINADKNTRLIKIALAAT
jgi:hypothetical protein